MNIDMVAVTSSNLDFVGYNADEKVLRVQFKNGNRYDYDGVSEGVHHALVNAGSVGQYFNANIRNSYPYAQV